MAYKKTFVIGAKLLASEITDNFTILEPIAEASAESPAYLTCGTAGSLASFQAVTDGTFRISINGLQYDVESLAFPPEITEAGSVGGAQTTAYNKYWLSQSFVTGASQTNVAKIKLENINTHSSGKVFASIRAVSGSLPTGSDIDGERKKASSTSPTQEWEFDNPVTVSPNTEYCVVFEFQNLGSAPDNGIMSIYAGDTTGSVIAGQSTDGTSWSALNGTYDMAITQYESTDLDYDGVAGVIQTALRLETGGDETVEFDTDHFIFTSGITNADSAISVLSSTGSGTDLSGTSYLNGATNGVVTAREASNDRVIKTNAEGLLDETMIKSTDQYAEGNQANWTGGNQPSTVGTFATLANGTNDGAIGITIDGVTYDQIPVSQILIATSASNIISQTGSTQTGNLTSNEYQQTFTLPSNAYYLTAIAIRLEKVGAGGGDVTLQLKSGTTVGAGTVLATATRTASEISGDVTINFNFPSEVEVSPSTGYHFEVTCASGNGSDYYIMYKNSVGSINGSFYINESIQTGDMTCTIKGKTGAPPADQSDIAQNLQNAIRAVTGGTETVEFLPIANKYKITSGTTGYGSEASNPTTPTSGTDISGAGATPYYDLADGAQDADPNSANKVVKTKADGKIDPSLVDPIDPEQMTTTERDASSPTAGKLIYNTTTNKLNFYNGTAWEVVTSA